MLWPIHRSETLVPLILLILINAVMPGSAVGAHFCQASIILTARATGRTHGWINTVTVQIGCTATTNSVAIPSAPPPPPRHAQNRSGFVLLLADTTVPVAVTKVTAFKLS